MRYWALLLLVGLLSCDAEVVEDDYWSDDRYCWGIAKPSSMDCNGITHEGECHGDMVVWCEEEVLWCAPCHFHNWTCGWKEEPEVFGCVE